MSDPKTGETGPRQVVVATGDHRYWNETDGEWQERQDLDAGDRLLTADGDIVMVEGLDWTTLHTDAAYDLDVAGIDSYYVGAGEEWVLVHDDGDCDVGHGVASFRIRSRGAVSAGIASIGLTS